LVSLRLAAFDHFSTSGDFVTGGWGFEGNGRCLGLWTTVACVLVLTACGSSSGGGATPDPTATVTKATAPPVAAELLGITWTTAVDPETQAPENEVTAFPIDAPSIIAAVEVGELQAGTVLTATWFIDGMEVPQATMQVTAQQDLQEGWATFQFTRAPDRLFPLGELEVRVTAVDGSEVTGSVDVVLPESGPG
jgi:hypothetical protein